ncbi:hypothetical protein DL96DRAFT_1468582, partial [Flagelloscypha sp. PMI_526]
EPTKRVLDDDCPYTLTSMNNLAHDSSNRDQHQNALKLNEEVLELRKRVLGNKHPNTLTSLNPPYLKI